jgi:sugar/nucleoside kinase (ribokinase family)
MTSRPPDIVFLGNLIVDDLVFTDGRTRFGLAGGAMLYATLGAGVWGARVAVVAPVGDDYPREALEAMKARGVDLSGLRPLGRPGLRHWLLYERTGRRVIRHLDAAPHVEASPRPEDLRAVPAEARTIHLAPVPIECHERLLEPLATRSGVHLSLDPHDPINEATLDRWRPMLGRVDLLFVSREEIDLPGLDADPETSLRTLAGGRLASIALKLGADGGVHYDVAGRGATLWAPWAHGVADPTGAGDAFAGGFLTGRIAGLSLVDCLARGAVSASFAIETLGADGLLGATPDEARRRFDTWRGARVE